MAWHLHTVKHRLVLASLIRRNVYTSASVCCFLRGGCVSVYHCCLHHHNFVKPACHHHHQQQQSANKHTNSEELHANRSSFPHLPWDTQQILSSPSDESQASRRDHAKESSTKICAEKNQNRPSPDEYRPSCSHHHIPRSQSLHWDRRETDLMCINQRCGHYVRVSDTERHTPLPSAGDPHHTETAAKSTTGNKHTETDEEKANTPLVFKLDSKGRQHMLDLLAVEKKSTDHQSAIDALNQFVDIIKRKESTSTSNHHGASPSDQESNVNDNDVKETSATWKHHQHHHLRESSSHNQDYDYRVNIKTVPEWPTSGQAITGARHPRYNSAHHAAVGSNHVALCSGQEGPPVDQESDRSRDKPSKEQLAEMYHRLYTQIPNFYSQSHDYTMYSDNLVFDNRILNVQTVGLPAYKATLQSLKYLSTACLWKVNLEVLSLTINTEMNCVQARWRVTGVPLHHLIFFPWRKSSKKYFDAFSSFDVGSDGLIHKHTVDRLMPNPGDKIPSLVTRIGMALGIIRPQAPAPAMQAGNVNLTWFKPRWRLKNNGIIP